MDEVGTKQSVDAPQSAQDSTAAQPFKAHELFAQSSSTAAATSGDKVGASAGLLPPVSLVEFEQRADNLVKDVKVDSHGNYRGEDLVKMMQNPAIKGEDAVVAATIYNTYKNSQHGFGPKDLHDVKDVTFHDLDDMANLKSLSSKAGFAAADKNHDGRLSAPEIEGKPARAGLVDYVPSLKLDLDAHPKGLSRGDIAEVYGRAQATEQNSCDVEASQQYFAGRLEAATTRSLFKDNTNPLASIKMEDVQQGQTGDCYFHAVLGDVAKVHPELIANAIKDNKNGSFTVTFPGDKKHPMTVAAPTDAELASYAGANGDGVWPAVMEKAYAKYSVDVLQRPQFLITPQDAIKAGAQGPVIELLTGHRADEIFSPPCFPTDAHNHPVKGVNSAAKVRDTVVQALHDGRVVTFCLLTDKGLAKGIDTNHAYSVVGYKPDAHGGSFVLRDPRGENRPGAPKNAVITFADLQHVPLAFSLELPTELKDRIARSY